MKLSMTNIYSNDIAMIGLHSQIFFVINV